MTGVETAALRLALSLAGDKRDEAIAELVALKALHSDLISMAERFIPSEQLPAWRECVDLRLADAAAYMQRLHRDGPRARQSGATTWL